MDRISRERAQRLRYLTRRMDLKFVAAVVALAMGTFLAIFLYQLTRF